ncbi:Uncharacterized protein Fot_47883 [Forsythia ovata]|uniref:Uncharacterized protein n=1 Tax=Forsythia ovata TaxID=205694 RepID=A0ABD1QV96_9LAMI
MDDHPYIRVGSATHAKRLAQQLGRAPTLIVVFHHTQNHDQQTFVNPSFYDRRPSKHFGCNSRSQSLGLLSLTPSMKHNCIIRKLERRGRAEYMTSACRHSTLY